MKEQPCSTGQCADCKHRFDKEDGHYVCKIAAIKDCVRYEKEEPQGKD